MNISKMIISIGCCLPKFVTYSVRFQGNFIEVFLFLTEKKVTIPFGVEVTRAFQVSTDIQFIYSQSCRQWEPGTRVGLWHEDECALFEN